MTRRERYLRIYSRADWFAYLLLSTCILAAINFFDIFVQNLAETMGTRAADGFVVTHCHFGPPASFHPRFFVLLALVVATLNVFKRTAFNRYLASVGSAGALLVYVLWWISSYHRLRNYEQSVEIRALVHPEIKQFAYLYQGTPLDLGIALSIAVCLVLLLDRLFDGEKFRI